MLNGIQIGQFKAQQKDVSRQAKLQVQINQSSFTSAKPNDKLNSLNLNNLKANFVCFGSNQPKEPYLTPEVIQLTSAFGPKMDKIWDEAVSIAKEKNSKEITTLHLATAFINHTIDALSGNYDPNYTSGALAQTILKEGPSLVQKPELQANVVAMIQQAEPIIKAEFDKLEKGATQKVSADLLKLLKNSTTETVTGLVINDIKVINNLLQKQDAVGQILNSVLYNGIDVARMIESKVQSDNYARHSGNTSNLPAPSDMYKTDNPLVKKPEKNFSNMPSADLLSFEHYEDKAKTLGAIVSGGGNVIYTQQTGATPELLAHSFTQLLRTNEFKDLNNENTMVNYIDANQLLAAGQLPLKSIEEIASYAQKDGKKAVVFVNDFDKLLTIMQAMAQKDPKLDPSTYFGAKVLGDNVHIVGIMNNTMYGALTNEPRMLPQIELKHTIENCFEKMSIGAPSPDKTKEMLLKEPRLLAPITVKFEQDIHFEPEAINKAVDLSVKIRKGAMPGKAIDLLNFVTGIKANATGNKFESITADDVAKLSQLYPELKQTPESDGTKFAVIHETGIRMKDVGGASQAKEVVDEILDFLKEPERFTKLGATMPKGVLLHGTPGNGKTHLAKAIAGEAGVPFISVSGSQFVEKYVGVGASRVRELFDFARDQARGNDQKTAIIFLDEFDAIGRARGGGNDGGSKESEHTLNELLVQMDGLSNNSDVNVVVLAATNRPDLLDTALTERPGRFDHKIEVPNPANDPQARYEILKVHTRGKKLAAKTDEAKEAMLRELADKTSGASGARLADIVNKAAMIAARDNREEITIDDLIEAKLESSFGRVNKNTQGKMWSKEITVAHECGHALVLQVFSDIAKEPWHKGSEIDTITLDPRGHFLGAVLPKPGENTTLTTFESLFGKMAMGYGGHSVEKALFNIDGSFGISQDLKQTTSMALHGITKMGMGPNTRLMSSTEDKFVQDLMKDEIKKDLILLTTKAAEASDKIVAFHKPFIEQYTQNFRDNAGKGGNNLSGEKFKEMLHNWRADNKEGFDKLKKEVYQIMVETQKAPRS